MSRPKSAIPAYLLHKATGQARCRINGRDFYLGPYGSYASREAYGKLIAEHSTGKPFDPFSRRSTTTITTTIEDAGPSVAELCVAFLRHADSHYRKNGKRTAEYDCFKSAIAPLVELYGVAAASEFGPTALKAVRNAMVAKGWCRKYVNKSVGRIRTVFRYGVENEMIDAMVVERLKSLSPLLEGRTDAPDYDKREAVPLEHIEAVKTKLSQRNRDLIDLQLLTGARPGELMMLTTPMIDRSDSVWVANIEAHKMQHTGTKRRLFFGPKSQLILTKYLTANGDRLFPILRRTYGDAVVRACDRAGVPRFSPHWLRHNAATDIRDTVGVETAQAVLGHAKPDMTAAYSRKLDRLAMDHAAKCG